MASDMEKLQNLLARHTGKMKDALEADIGELNRATRVLEHGNDLVEDLMILVGDMIDKRIDDQERDRDRYEDRFDDRRDSRRGRDDRRDSRRDDRGGRRGWNDRR